MRSASTAACGVSGVITTSLVMAAKAACSILITYRPRDGNASVKEPSMLVAEETFFPVRVLEALTAAPGRGVFADLPSRAQGIAAQGSANHSQEHPLWQ